MSISAAKCTSSRHKLGYHYHSTKSSSVAGCNSSITLWNRERTCDVTINKVSYGLTLFKWVCVFKGFGCRIYKKKLKKKLSKHSGKRVLGELGVRSSLQTLLCHILTIHHWITVKMGGREQMVWQGGGCVSIMYLLGSLLSLAKYMSRNHSPRSAWRCCVKLRWELEDGKEKKRKGGPKGAAGLYLAQS